jgi:glycerophosphoryl diester phosphodiesterase
MHTLQQLGNLVGISARPVSLKAVAQMFGISVPFSCKQLSETAQSGNVPRPFYIVGHNPNTIPDVIAALDAGANAIEPDVNVYADNEGELCISHSEGEPGAPSLVQFLSSLHDVAIQRPALALVVFDCKEKVTTAQHGTTLRNAIRALLTSGTELNVIISVSSFSETAIFDNIKNGLEPREGLMIDEENDPIAVSNFFTTNGVENQCFGNGISFLNEILGPNVRPSMERVCEFRAESNRTRFIYVWTVQDDDLLREYIHIGVDGIITDDVAKLRRISNESQFRSVIRLAARNDDPFSPANLAYGLTIHTGDTWMAGTDANVTFTLTGAAGSASVTVDTSRPRRMERNDWNFVTLQSLGLGALQSITVQRDNEGNGPDWFLDRILVASFRFGASKRADFNRWIDSTSPFTQALV